MDIIFQPTDREEIALDELCEMKGLNRIQIMRQALRLYQSVQHGHYVVIESRPVNMKAPPKAPPAPPRK